jgi:hypothetical protein
MPPDIAGAAADTATVSAIVNRIDLDIMPLHLPLANARGGRRPMHDMAAAQAREADLEWGRPHQELFERSHRTGTRGAISRDPSKIICPSFAYKSLCLALQKAKAAKRRLLRRLLNF